MNLGNEIDYLNNYQYNHFQETTNDLYKTVDIKRKCLVQSFKASNSLGKENVRDLIEEGIKECNEFVDDQSVINNYASTIENLTENVNKSHCLQWKHELKVEDFDNMIKSLQCCSDNEIPEQEFATLFQKKLLKVEPAKHNTYNVARQNQPSTVNNKSNIRNQALNVNIQKKLSVEDNRTHNFQKNSCVEDTGNNKRNNCGFFKTARDELEVQNAKKYGSKQNGNNNQQQQPLFSYGAQKKSLGARRGVQGKFIPPVRTESNEAGASSLSKQNSPNWDSEEIVDERLKNIDPKMVELIRSEIMDSGAPISWDDIAGLEFAKTIIKEVVVWPLLRPDIFTGLRRPPKGILLFGPPGTGKTLIGKCIASQSQSTFFSISASSLTSKWIGDGEKMVRAMFTVARCHQPAVVFIDEIDSLLSQRSDTEHESSRRIKTEFLVQLDGAATGDEDRILVIGATNRPQELDEAARRRFVKRLYIPLPEKLARLELVKRLMNNERNELSDENIIEIADLSDGYSGADMKSLCAEASLGPIRSIDISMIQNIQADQVRAITMQDFRSALSRVRASVSPGDLEQYVTWDRTYGAGGW